MTVDQFARMIIATREARKVVKVGDRISRRMCCDLKGTFTFLAWDGDWMCGRTVSDCCATAVYKVNGQPVSFGDGPIDDATMAQAILRRDASILAKAHREQERHAALTDPDWLPF